MLQIVEINPKSIPKASVIWLHGLGASGHDFIDIVPELKIPEELNVRFVFPHAPFRKVTYAGGEKLRAWFNISSLDSDFKEDEEGIRDSEALIEELIKKELDTNIPSDKIILAGFSQGGVMALHCGLRYKASLGGILVLSAWLALNKSLQSEKSIYNQDTPILMEHGTHDELIPLEWAEKSCNYLKEEGYSAKLDSYPMGHHVCHEEIVAIGKWLRERLS